MIGALLPEFDQEIAVTRRLLARAPDASFGWAPHPKSFTLGDLCTHLTRLPGWGLRVLTQAGHDVITDHRPATPSLATRAEVLAAFDQTAASLRTTLAGMSDAELALPWHLTRNGSTTFTAPRLTAFRVFILHHLVHHRGQLSVYLRLLDVAVPAMYGPSADEPL
jgi:uncharacterized damage-inducible protein DinB